MKNESMLIRAEIFPWGLEAFWVDGFLPSWENIVLKVITTILSAKIDILSSSRMYFQVDYGTSLLNASMFHHALLWKPLYHHHKHYFRLKFFLSPWKSPSEYCCCQVRIEWVAAFSAAFCLRNGSLLTKNISFVVGHCLSTSKPG